MKGKCEQLLAAVNYVDAMTAAAARQDTGQAAPVDDRNPWSQKAMKIINHVFAYLQALTWSIHYITSLMESPEIR